MRYYKRLFFPQLSSPCTSDRNKIFHCARKVTHYLLKTRAKVCSPLKERTQRKIHLKRYVALVCLSPSLTGCMGIYEGGFECPAGTGVGCKSISEVNSMINAEELPKSHHTVTSVETNEGAQPCSSCGRASPQEKPEIWINPLYLKGLQMRNQEESREKRQKINQNKVLDDTISL